MSSLAPELSPPEVNARVGSPGDFAAPDPILDRRDGTRCQGDVWAGLLSLDGQEVIRCAPDDLGEGGLHFTAPVGYGFAVGQRYELVVGRGNDAGTGGNLIGEGHYATVVRTEFLLDEDADRVGVGLRFDQPIVI